jgi:hypothetical protein
MADGSVFEVTRAKGPPILRISTSNECQKIHFGYHNKFQHGPPPTVPAAPGIVFHCVFVSTVFELAGRMLSQCSE